MVKKRKLAAYILMILTAFALSVYEIHLRFTNIDMTELRLFLTYWKQEAIFIIDFYIRYLVCN